MKRLIAALATLLLLGGAAFAQPVPGPGPQPPPDPWVVSGNTINPNGREVVTTAPTTGASGFNLPHGTAPSSPNNGDVWTTTGGLYGQINGVTQGPYADTAHTNTFLALQNFDLGTGTEPAADTGTALAIYGANATTARSEITAFGATAVDSLRASNGTRASPSALTAGTLIASFNVHGYDGTAWTSTAYAAIHTYAEANWTSTSHPTEICIATTSASASASSVDNLCVHDNGQVQTNNIFGSTATNGTLNLYATNSLSASGDYVNIYAHNIQVAADVGGLTTLYVGAALNTGAIINIANSGAFGAGYQIWTPAANGVGTITFPATTDTLAGLAQNQTFTGNNGFTGTFSIANSGSLPSLANGSLALAGSATLGAVITGQGSSDDIIVENKSGGTVCAVATGSTTWSCAGLSTSTPLAVSSGGTSLATLTAHAVLIGEGTSNVAFATIGTAGRILFDQGSGNDPAFAAMSQDCTITDAGVITCLKTNNVSFGTAATVNTGTSGATIPLLNGNNTYSGTATFSSQIIPAYGTPTITSGNCGATTNGSLAAGSTNQSGQVQIGSANTTTCTINFSTTLSAAPLACTIEPANGTAASVATTGAYVSSISTTTFVITGNANSLKSSNYYYHCI